MRDDAFSSIAHYLSIWRLSPDGQPFETRSGWLLPVRDGTEPAMLKIYKRHHSGVVASNVLAHYAGHGAVRVVYGHGPAILMERACGVQSLRQMVQRGEDMAAARILGETLARLHAPSPYGPPKGIATLRSWFGPLIDAANATPQLRIAAETATELVDGPRSVGVLHGDLHHDNVVDGGARGWLAIDPEGLYGEHAYDVANLLRNPEGATGLILSRDRLRRHAELYGACLDMEPRRILRFALAHAGLSAAWSIEDKESPENELRLIDVLTELLDGGATRH